MNEHAEPADEWAVTLSPAGPDSWRRWRELRRAALAEAPGAFSSTLTEWSGAGDTETRWRDRLASMPLNLIAQIGRRGVGMASATAPTDDELELISMWVAPDVRGRGIGDALIGAVATWAAAQGVSHLALEVREDNAPAIALYRRHGFVEDGLSRSDPDCELRMVRPLARADEASS